MKRSSFSVVPSAALLLAIALPMSSVQAQAVTTALAAAATEACTRSAESKGFQVKEVVSVEPKAGTEGANVVLNLDRDGQAYKLTCGYSESGGATIGDDTSSTTSSTTSSATSSATSGVAPNLSNLWWLLLPIIGLPLLLVWTKHRDRAVSQTYAESAEGLVKNNGKSLSVHSEPDDSHAVTGVLYDGQRVALSGRRQDNWAELAEGGWVPAQCLDMSSSYVTQ